MTTEPIKTAEATPELPPLSEGTLTAIYDGLEFPNLAAIRAMIREIRRQSITRAPTTFTREDDDAHMDAQGGMGGVPIDEKEREVNRG